MIVYGNVAGIIYRNCDLCPRTRLSGRRGEQAPSTAPTRDTGQLQMHDLQSCGSRLPKRPSRKGVNSMILGAEI